jgi:hypothetical protein
MQNSIMAMTRKSMFKNSILVPQAVIFVNIEP